MSYSVAVNLGFVAFRGDMFMEMDKDLSEMVSVDELKDWTFPLLLTNALKPRNSNPKR